MTLSSARRPCCARSGGPPDLLMVGDSSIDFMKFQGEPGSYEQREQWATLQQRFSEVGFRVDNIGCGGAPFYELCLGTFCYMCRRATRPTTGIITSMGGNDFTACPFPMCCPGVGTCCSCVGCDCVGGVFDCWMSQLACCSSAPASVNVIFLNDIVQSEYINPAGETKHGMGQPCGKQCGGFGGDNDAYKKYGASIKDKAGTVLTPSFADHAAGVAWLEENEAHFPTQTTTGVPTFEFNVTSKTSAKYPHLIYVDEGPLVSKLRIQSPAAYAKLFGNNVKVEGKQTTDATEGEHSVLMKAMWAEWMVYAAKEIIKAPRQSSPDMDRGGGAKVVPEP
jgi:hypothetical protein